MLATMISVNLKDKQLNDKLQKQKPPIMIFGCQDSMEKCKENDMIKIIDPIFTHNFADDKYLFDMYVPVFTNSIQIIM